jgi:hypothetical protein
MGEAQGFVRRSAIYWVGAEGQVKSIAPQGSIFSVIR